MNTGQILEALNDKADRDIQNIDNTGKSLVAGFPMPSDTYDDLILGASGTEYTAPADGYITLNQRVSSGYWCLLKNITLDITIEHSAPVSNANLSAIIPVREGDKFTVSYDSGLGTTDRFRFYYTEGSKWEAN